MPGGQPSANHQPVEMFGSIWHHEIYGARALSATGGYLILTHIADVKIRNNATYLAQCLE